MNGLIKDGLLPLVKEGEISIRAKQKSNKIELIKDIKNSKVYKDVLEKFPDANLIDVVTKTNDKD